MTPAAGSAAQIRREVDALADDQRAVEVARFFKTGPGQYGEGDVFAGVRVPALRAIARGHKDLALDAIAELLTSPVHEHRTVALVILTERARRADAELAAELYDFYLAHTAEIRNWDHVDLSATEVVGGHLLTRADWSPLKQLADSPDLWERRIAIIASFKFIRAGQLEPTFALAEQLLADEHDLMHKAVGWMLREAGKRDRVALERFLGEHAGQMPRTMLRYSIEHMPPEERAAWRAVRHEQEEQGQT